MKKLEEFNSERSRRSNPQAQRMLWAMQKPLPSVLLFVACLILPAGAVNGQQKPAPPSIDRPAGVLVDFGIVARDGTPVTDLTAAEVAVRINGRVRPIQSLRLMKVAEPTTEGSAPAAAPATLPPPYGANSHSSAATGRRVILAIDNDSFRAGSEAPLRESVNGLISELTPRDRVLLVTMPYGGVKVPFTDDHARIRTALSTLSGQRAQNETGSEMACRTRRLLETLAGFLDSIAGDETPATMIFFTSGLAAPRRDALAGLAPGMCELDVRAFERVAVAAGAARATFYVVHPDDLPRDGSPLAGGALGSDNPLEGIENLAGVTGAQRLPLLALGTGALDRVARESSAYYVAELAPEKSDFNGESRRLNVRTTRPDVTVRARPAITFAAPRPLAPKRTPPTVHQMLMVAEEFAELPLRVAGFTTLGTEGKLKVIAIAESGDPSAILATAATALVDTAGRVVAQWTAADAAEIPLAGAMLAEAGTYRLRVAATDTTGRFGTADTQVVAELTPAGPFKLSSLVMGLSREGALTPRLEFGNEPVALGSFELYGATGPGTRVRAVLDVARTMDGPALVSIPLALDRAADDRVVATGAVPIGALPAGDYIVRGTIGVEGGASGRVVRTMRKR
jgi:VWFA-related protein